MNNTTNQVTQNETSKLIALLLWFFFGMFGVHWIQLGDMKMFKKRLVQGIVCLVTSVLIVPLIILCVILIKDLIHIIKN